MIDASWATAWCKDSPHCWTARVPLAPQLSRQAKVCEAEDVAFQSKIELMETLICEFEPVAGTRTYVLLDSWSCAKSVWHAARERDFLIATGLKSNRWLRGGKPVYVPVVNTRVRTLSCCQVVIVRQTLDAPLSQAQYWAESDVEASTETLLADLAARWDIEVLFADGKEELGLDHSPLMSATALLRFWILALLAYVFLEEEQQRLHILWQRSVTIGEARRGIQRCHRRRLLMWLHQQFLSGVHPETLFDSFAA